MQGGKKRSGAPGMGDRPLKKRLKKSSAEPEAQAGPMNGKAGRGVMGLNPLVGHKVDRFWADVSAQAFRHLLHNLAACLLWSATVFHEAEAFLLGCCGDCLLLHSRAQGFPVAESSVCNEQDNKWWNGIITDFNGLTGEHW